ncbi:MAG: restriction endonuclease subunit S [Chitinophagaceae bacterium]|nr:restriction endonuclease subunit S [Chitinophagaceae bacterium]
MNWNEDKIENVIEKIATGKTPPTSNKEYFDGDINWYTPSDVVNNIALNRSSRTITQKAIDDNKAIVFESDTLLITCIGNIGRLGLTTKKSSSNQQITGLKFKPFIYPRFAFYYFLFIQSHLMQKANSAVVPILNNAGLKEIRIRYPDLKTQQEIAHVLEQADKARQQRKAANALTDEFLQSSFLSLFGDPVKNEKGWEVEKLEELATVNPRMNEEKDLPEDYQVSFIPMAAVDDIKGRIKTFYQKQIKEVKKGFTYFKEDDVLFAKITPCMENGKAAIARGLLNGIGFGTTEFHVIRCGSKIIPEYIYSIIRFQQFRDIAADNMTGSAGQRRVPSEFLKQFQIPIPPLSLQQQFAAIVAEAEALRKKQQESEQELEQLFQSLLQKYFG